MYPESNKAKFNAIPPPIYEEIIKEWTSAPPEDTREAIGSASFDPVNATQNDVATAVNHDSGIKGKTLHNALPQPDPDRCSAPALAVPDVRRENEIDVLYDWTTKQLIMQFGSDCPHCGL